MKVSFSLVVLGLAAGASAQIPDVKLHLDAVAAYRDNSLRNTRIRYYSSFGQFSTVALQFELEPGFTAFLSQKLERIPGDHDNNSIDEGYVEDPGIWRIGKQYLPFGTGNILKESVYSVRTDTQLVLEQLPIRVAYCDAGDGRQQGVVARLGTNVGMSLAIGEHFGINGTSLTQIRRPEDARLNSGYRRAFGMDAGLNYGAFGVVGEAVILREGESPVDVDRSIFDLSATFRQRSYLVFSFGFTHEVTSNWNTFRALAEVEMTENLSARPYVRMRNGGIWDAGFELRIKL